MSDTAAWPDPSRPGVPLNPERDGWHFLIDPFGDLFVREWSAGAECWYEDYSPNKRPTKWRYLGPALARAEVAAAVAAAFDDGARAMREAAARDVGCGCDNRDAVVSARSNAERSRLCGRAPCAALSAMDIRMLPLPAMGEEPSVERTGMAVVGPDERRAMDDALRRSVTITDDCAAPASNPTAGISASGPCDGLGAPDPSGPYVQIRVEGATQEHFLRISRGAAEVLIGELQGVLGCLEAPDTAASDAAISDYDLLSGRYRDEDVPALLQRLAAERDAARADLAHLLGAAHPVSSVEYEITRTIRTQYGESSDELAARIIKAVLCAGYEFCPVAARNAAIAERDRLREAVRKIAGISNECTWTPKLRPLAAELQDIIRAALPQPPAKETGNE